MIKLSRFGRKIQSSQLGNNPNISNLPLKQSMSVQVRAVVYAAILPQKISECTDEWFIPDTKSVLGKWILLQHCMRELKGIFQEEDKVIRDLQTQDQQVVESSWIRFRSSTIPSCNIMLCTIIPKCSFTYHFTSPPIQIYPLPSHVHSCVHATVFFGSDSLIRNN